MRGALDTFRQEANQLIEFLRAAIAEEALNRMLGQLAEISGDPAEQEALSTFLRATTNKRTYTYVVGIIMTYGALESFVRNAVQEYLQIISKVSGVYSGLPSQIIKNHLFLSINYLQSVRDGRVTSDDTVELVVHRLAKCLRQESDYALNANAFTAKSQNINRARVRHIAQDLGIDLSPKRLLRTRAATEFCGQSDPSMLSSDSDENAQALFYVVDRITNARNLISHGVADLLQIESPGILLDYTEEVLAYCSAVTEVLEQEAVLHALNVKMCACLAEPIATFGENIVCFSLDEGRVRKGDVLVLRTADTVKPVRYSPIESIQIDGVNYEEVAGFKGCKIGVKVGFRVARVGGYYVLSNDAKQVIFA